MSWRASGLSLPSTTCDTASVPAAKKISYGYDTLNRLTSTTYGDGSPAITRSYTADGLPNTITSNGAVWTNGYNKRRLNESETLAYGGANYRIGRTYDANGALSHLTYPDNAVVAYNPNALGEPRQVGTYATAVGYFPNGALQGFNYGNGITHRMTQNRRGLAEWSIDESASLRILRDNYNYDGNANVTSILDWMEGVSNRENQYDNLDRLTRVHSSPMWGDATYTYDALDNLTSTVLTAGTAARSTTHAIDPATNRLTGISGGGPAYTFSYAYDSQGNITQRGAQSYVFDQGNRLTSAVGKATYGYDGMGHRISVVGTDGVNRVQVYSQGGQLLYVKATNSPTATKYIYLNRHVVAEVTGSTVVYNHTDGLGSPVAQTNAAGARLNQTRYEPYGAVLSGNAGRIGYTGHVNDTETGLVYMQQRYYDPVAGRMLSIDPVTTDGNTGGSFNRYNYASNNPYKYIDPDGRNAALAGQAAIGGTFVCGPVCGAIAGGAVLIGGTYATAKIVNWMQSSSSAGADDKPSLVDGKGEPHILDGDKTGGGHRPGTGNPGKSEFPAGWTDPQILGEISDVATAPDSNHTTGNGGRTISTGTRGGVDITTVTEPGSKGGRIVTGFPTNVPRNPPENKPPPPPVP